MHGNPKPTATVESHPAPAIDNGRRSMLVKASAVVIGALATVVPFLAGLVTFLDPLRGHGNGKRGRLIRVCSLNFLPDDGLPCQFPVIADRTDAWNHYPPQPIGVVYLRRVPGSTKVRALNATCPHAGCLVGFDGSKKAYACPCHTSAFDLDGKCTYGPSPRAMDELDVQLKGQGPDKEIWVRYQDFYTTKTEKRPKA